MIETINNEEEVERDNRPGSLKVLYLGRNHCDFIVVQDCLQEAKGFQAIELTHAGTVEDALDLLSRENEAGYDAVLADLNLSDSGEKQNYHRLLDGAKSSAVVVLSDKEISPVRSAPNFPGAGKYLSTAPVHPDILAQTIVHAVEWKKAEDELDRLREELKNTRMQLIQCDKLATLGRLASGVAHEVKNPLASLYMGVAYLEGNPDADEASREVAFTEMTEAIERAGRIINEMVDFSGASRLDVQSTDVNELIRRSARLLRHDFTNKSTKLIPQLNESLPPARADADKIEQVLINLFINAMHSMGKGGKIQVRTSFVDQIESFEGSGVSYGTLQEGDHLKIEIRDFGPGIPEDTIEHVFEAFYTTKPKGEGTGLGLAVAGSILELHHGAIYLNNETDPSGLRISLVLPAYT